MVDEGGKYEVYDVTTMMQMTCDTYVPYYRLQIYHNIDYSKVKSSFIEYSTVLYEQFFPIQYKQNVLTPHQLIRPHRFCFLLFRISNLFCHTRVRFPFCVTLAALLPLSYHTFCEYVSIANAAARQNQRQVPL